MTIAIDSSKFSPLTFPVFPMKATTSLRQSFTCQSFVNAPFIKFHHAFHRQGFALYGTKRPMLKRNIEILGQLIQDKLMQCAII